MNDKFLRNDIVENYGWSTEEEPCSCNYIAPRITDILARLNAKRVLDIGSGNGALCARIATAGYEVVGVDFDKKGIELAQRTYPNIPFYNFGIHEDSACLLKNEREFDIAVSTEVIEHLFSPHLLPIYAKGCIKKGGHLIISTPYHGYLKNLAISALDKWDLHHTVLWHGGHIKFWSRATLTKLLSESGFRVEEFYGVGRLPYLWKSMILVAKKL